MVPLATKLGTILRAAIDRSSDGEVYMQGSMTYSNLNPRASMVEGPIFNVSVLPRDTV